MFDAPQGSAGHTCRACELDHADIRSFAVLADAEPETGSKSVHRRIAIIMHEPLLSGLHREGDGDEWNNPRGKDRKIPEQSAGKCSDHGSAINCANPLIAACSLTCLEKWPRSIAFQRLLLPDTRRRTDDFPERGIEAGLRSEAAGEGDLDHGQLTLEDQPLRQIDPPYGQVSIGRISRVVFEAS